jgi:hypothetical protein
LPSSLIELHWLPDQDLRNEFQSKLRQGCQYRQHSTTLEACRPRDFGTSLLTEAKLAQIRTLLEANQKVGVRIPVRVRGIQAAL